MSRCFPYPPPHYSRREEQPLAESIKLQKEREIAKESRKEKKKDKHENKEEKEKRHKSKHKHERAKDKEHGHKKRKYDERNELKTDYAHCKAAAKDTIEQLEKSGLTEEHLLPLQKPCESSESTQNSHKSGKLEPASIPGGGNGGTKLRLTFSLNKHEDLVPTQITDEPCFSGRVSSSDLEAIPAKEGQLTFKYLKAIPATRAAPDGRSATPSTVVASKDVRPTSVTRATTEDLKVTSGRKFTSEDTKAATTAVRTIPECLKTLANEKARSSGWDSSRCLGTTPPTGARMELEVADKSGRSEGDSHSRKDNKRSRKLEKHFRDLILNWKPAQFLGDREAGTEDMGWLLDHSQQRHVSSNGAYGTVEDMNHGRSSSSIGLFQPRACYLPELEIYQLPYAVPF